MISNSELATLIERIRAAGATVAVTLDQDLRAEGREVIATVTVSGIRGIGPNPMPPIAAAQAIREALSRIASYEGKVEGRHDRLEIRAERLMAEGTAKVAAGDPNAFRHPVRPADPDRPSQ